MALARLSVCDRAWAHVVSYVVLFDSITNTCNSAYICLVWQHDTTWAAVRFSLSFLFVLPSTQSCEHTCTLVLFAVMESLWMLQSWVIALHHVSRYCSLVLSQLWSVTHSSPWVFCNGWTHAWQTRLQHRQGVRKKAVNMVYFIVN